MNAYDLSHMTDAQLYELYGRLLAQLDMRGLVVSADVTRSVGTFLVGHYPPADKPPPQPVINHY